MKNYDEIIGNQKIWNLETIPLGMKRALVKLPNCGTCSVIWSNNECGWEHVSVAPRKQFKIPSWNDMCALKDMFFYDEEEVYQIHPKKSKYINIKSNCLHLWKPIGHEINELVVETVKQEGADLLSPLSDGTPRGCTGKRKWCKMNFEKVHKTSFRT